jgi:5-carboxyvanillate decarboxylase
MPAPEPIRFAQKQMGDDHVLYAMDYPYQNEHFEVALNEEALTDANRKMFFEDNARGLFHIDGPVGA